MICLLVCMSIEVDRFSSCREMMVGFEFDSIVEEEVVV